MTLLKNIPSLAERIKYIRKMKGLSQIDLARIAETTQQAIQQAESGKAQSPRYLHKISMELDVPYEWLTMNLMPEKKREQKTLQFAEKGKEVLDNFFSMSKKDQSLMLELMKSRQKKD